MPKPTILDNIDEIKKIDKSNMLSFCAQAPKHYGNAAKLPRQFKISYRKPETIIVAGMGGSAIGGELLKDWARDRMTLPVDVCREYHLPAYANNGSNRNRFCLRRMTLQEILNRRFPFLQTLLLNSQNSIRILRMDGYQSVVFVCCTKGCG